MRGRSKRNTGRNSEEKSPQKLNWKKQNIQTGILLECGSCLFTVRSSRSSIVSQKFSLSFFIFFYILFLFFYLCILFYVGSVSRSGFETVFGTEMQCGSGSIKAKVGVSADQVPQHY
jgi:hypothetical protein